MFSDADMTGDIDGRWSTSGVLVFLRVSPNFMAVAEIEGGGAIYVRGRVRSGGHSGMPSCVCWAS